MKLKQLTLAFVAGLFGAGAAGAAVTPITLSHGKILVEYDFTGDTPLAPSSGSGVTLRTNGWGVQDGKLVCNTQSQSNGAYYKSNEPIISTSKDWQFSLTGTFTVGSNAYAISQFGSSDYAGYTSVFGLYVGNNSTDRGVVGIQFGADSSAKRYILTGNTWKGAISNVETTYSLVYTKGELHFLINGVDYTNDLTAVGTTDDLQKTYSDLNQSGMALAKIGYANELGIGNGNNGAPVGSSISKVSVVTVPEPATATLSLLALAGLATRRRRKQA